MINGGDDKLSAFINAIKDKKPAREANSVFAESFVSPVEFDELMSFAQGCTLSEQMRIYRILSLAVSPDMSEELKQKSLKCIREAVSEGTVNSSFTFDDIKIKKDKIDISLPLRVNWCGTWTDAPPYCTENGGAVVNAAVKIDGHFPVKITIEKLKEKKIILKSVDGNSEKEFTDISSFLDCADPLDSFSLQKAALIAGGIIPPSGLISLESLCDKLGGGIMLATGVLNIPKGSGLGTSSILLCACIRGISEFIGQEMSEEDIFRRVLFAEQIMGTGGGWQDQAGGLVKGIKLVHSESGNRQNIKCDSIIPTAEFADELKRRFCLIYTGQRRYGRTVLREIMGKYLENDSVTLNALSEIHRLAYEMQDAISKGDMNNFISLMNSQLSLTKCLDSGYSNDCIERIFAVCEDMTDGKMICGAGGGGFLQVILKKNVTADDLRARIDSIFKDEGVAVWDCEFVF